MVKLIKDCLTGKDNKTYDVGRVLAVASVILYWYVVLKTGATNLVEIGSGLAATIAGCCGGLYFKRKTEP